MRCRQGGTQLRDWIVRGWLLGRQHISTIQHYVHSGEFQTASNLMKDLRFDDLIMDDELRANVAYWQAILISVESPEDPGGKIAGLADEAANIFERLQRRDKWIDALILKAEQDLEIWSDDSYIAASIASEL